MGLRDRARKLFGRDTLSEHSVVASKVEHIVFDDVRKRSTAISDAVDQLPQLKDGDALDGKVWERMAEDLWSEFYGLDEPAIRSRQKIDQRFRINRECADKQARDDAFSDLHAKTRGDKLAASLATLGALDSLRQSYGEELSEHAERANEIADTENNLDSIDERMEQLRQQRRDLSGDHPDIIDDEMRELGRSKQQTKQRLDAAMVEQRNHAGDLQDAVRVAVGKAAEKADQLVEVSALTKGTQEGPGGVRTVEQALAFADRVGRSRKLKNVLERLGRLEVSMGATRRQLRRGGYEEIVDIETGDDLRNILPQEKMLLMHPVGRLDFFRRFSERSLMQYETWSMEELKRGSLVIGVDGSQSMEGPPDEFARGLSAACIDIAHREGRDCAAMEFATAGQLREFRFPKAGPLDMGVLMDFAEHFYRGGTDINQVLERAAEIMDAEAPFHSADLIIVTDGGDHVTERTIQLRDHLRSMGVKIHGLSINSNPTNYLLEVCDNVSAVWEFDGPNETSDRLAINLS